jgi:hypothetical protein
MNPPERNWEFYGPNCIMYHDLSSLVSTEPRNGYQEAEGIYSRFGFLRVLNF